jgi:hypothetical protein
MIFVSESNRTDLEQKIGSEVAQFVYKVPKKNHDAMMQLNKQFVSTMRKYGATHLVLHLNSTEARVLPIYLKLFQQTKTMRFGWS